MADRDYVTCHILDTVKGEPAAGVRCELSRIIDAQEQVITAGTTDADGRVAQWDSPRVLTVNPGVHKIKFETGSYLSASSGGQAFFPVVEVVFVISDPPQPHYHIPLLLSNYSYSTYRGS